LGAGTSWEFSLRGVQAGRRALRRVDQLKRESDPIFFSIRILVSFLLPPMESFPCRSAGCLYCDGAVCFQMTEPFCRLCGGFFFLMSFGGWPAAHWPRDFRTPTPRAFQQYTFVFPLPSFLVVLISFFPPLLQAPLRNA